MLCFVHLAESGVKKYDFSHVPTVEHICIIWREK